MENKEQEEEPEIITFKEILERHKDMKEEELHKLVLVCKNCGHQDLLKNFIKNKSEGFERMNISVNDPQPLRQWKRWNPRDKMTCTKNKEITMMVIVNNTEYEDMFFCPKCDSSLVCLNPKFVKNNIARTLEEKED